MAKKSKKISIDHEDILYGIDKCIEKVFECGMLYQYILQLYEDEDFQDLDPSVFRKKYLDDPNLIGTFHKKMKFIEKHLREVKTFYNGENECLADGFCSWKEEFKKRMNNGYEDEWKISGLRDE